MNQNFAAYLIGFVVLVAGLAYAAHLAHVPSPWIGAGVVVLIGLGILKAVTRTQHKTYPDS
ncbi:MAG TPA: hypothetical protein VHR45_04485 [Thermoanaerobaculia bacterium]|nr:hypothetical protein [Thermoanaerobaculia bacterium]